MHSPSKNQDSPSQAPPVKEQLDFKQQLDQKADESRTRENGNGGESFIETVVHKISQAIPATVPILGGSNPEGKVEDEGEAGPPNRPENDVQIEEFVREQHRSKYVGETDEGANLSKA
ncbi:hypothetical protein TRIATDRAFT_302211 [Trichoderma atroviride IMI 206040]|uniref:Uncharacterized protein n=1 Tax=Hypocrea atroviridis (strain ATCC 20476 / IMI 206040) TaxID=452589 RepID=G9P8W1_HYPAI|nr:uncharacterized protein TRIATDRAFT_302211 [Trichoderma atroviride IMI 206040]EHK41833.1 hypothetical protein TRIATDRAFT_302211 [Trichoderma atroviride IMI 206040]